MRTVWIWIRSPGGWKARGLRVIVSFMISIALAACGAGGERASSDVSDAADSILVFAASDLQAALAEIAAGFEAESGVGVTLVFGSTGNLTAQIENGAPADVFFAANEAFLDRLAAADLLREETRRLYARGRLALVAGPGAALPASIADLPAPGYRTIAIANPEHAPYGMAAREALIAHGLWDALRPRLVLAENVAQALQFVRSGNADAGVVAAALLPASAGRVLVPDSLHAPLDQGAAVLRASARSSAAGAFLDYVAGATGQATLRRYGFDPPPP